MRYLTFLSIILIAVAGCSESSSESSSNPFESGSELELTPVNQNCPIMGGAVTEDGGIVDFNGQNVGFCCAGCDVKWEALSAEEKTAKLAAADESHEAHDDHDHDDHDHGDHDHGDHDHGDSDTDAAKPEASDK